jgi:PAS domain S-box-containing protein
VPEEVLMESKAVHAVKKDKLTFVHLPRYASFVKDNLLVPYITEQLRISREIRLPMLRFFENIAEDELVTMSIPSNRLFLTYAAENRLSEQLKTSLANWEADAMGIIKKDEITAEDVTLAGFMRKKALTKFLPSYTNDIFEALEIIKEIDTYCAESDTAATNVYLKLLKNRISEQKVFSEVISNTTPGLNYVFNLAERRITYANDNYLNFSGHSLDNLMTKGKAVMEEMIHPEDLPAAETAIEQCMAAADKEIISWEHRLKDADGNFYWMRNYASVLKRDDEGLPAEVVGIILDINKEKEIADKLLLREKQLLEAQAQAQVGSFELDMPTGKMDVTPQFREIYEVDSDFNLTTLVENIHPSDRSRVEYNRAQANDEGDVYDNEYRYTVHGKEKVIRSRGVISYKNGRKTLNGTAMDITSQHKMVNQLIKSEALYKQAQALAHIGNWVWDLSLGQCTWSDELYRIYELNPASTPIDINFSKTFRHPDDAEMVDAKMKRLRESHEPCEYTYRIILGDDKIKFLHVVAEISYDENGIPARMFGTVQDVTEKQALVQKLQHNESLYKQAQALGHIGNWTWNINDKNMHWSEEMFRIYEIEEHNQYISRAQATSFRHPEDHNLVTDQIAQILKSDVPHDYHFRIITRSGKIKTLYTRGERRLTENGTGFEIFGITQDVTEKQDLISRLQQSEKLYKQAQQISHTGNWKWDIASSKLEWSDELYRIYELEPQSMKTGIPIALYNHPDDIGMISNTIKAAIDTMSPFDFIYRVILESGNLKYLNAKGSVNFDSNKSPVSIYGTIQDITKQKETEKRIKEYQEFVQKITDVTPSIITAYNINSGQYSFVNDAIEKLLGYPAARVKEEGVAFVSSLVHPDDVAALADKNTAALREANTLGVNNNELVAEYKYRMRHASGEYRWFHTYGTVFERDSKGMVESVLDISIDITEQEIAEQLLFQKNQQLQQSNASLEEYAYVASHDLKEPLRKIATFSDRLLTTQHTTLNDDGKVYLKKIIESSRRMQKMIGDLLSVSTIQGNKSYKQTDLNTILAEALQPLDHKIEELGAVVTSDTLPRINVVASQFRQLFQNLVGNSLKFARAGVPSQISISHMFLNSDAGELYGLSKAASYLQIQLKDNGIGFDNQYAGKIFAIFQRLHGKMEYEGTGIGLTVCKKIVENHGGVIFAEGIPNQSATFTFIIPL